MEVSKYDRTIPLQCPTCGATDFVHTAGSDLVKCASCGRQMTKDVLMHENSENIQEHANEVAKQGADDFGRELTKTLQDAFKNSKFIKIK
jgi:transposase-like protein